MTVGLFSKRGTGNEPLGSPAEVHFLQEIGGRTHFCESVLSQ